MKKRTAIAALIAAFVTVWIVACGDSTKPADNPTPTSSVAPVDSAGPASSK